MFKLIIDYKQILRLKFFIFIFSVSFCTPSIDKSQIESLNYIELIKISSNNSVTSASSSSSQTSLQITYPNTDMLFTVNATISAQTPSITTNISSCISSPTLPTGLTLNSSNCEITGTPTTIQSLTTYTITATNDVESISTKISISIQAVPVFSVGYPNPTLTFTQNVTISAQTPVISNVPVTSCTGTLPTGLSLNNTTCEVTGTPTTISASTNYPITASNGTSSVNISLNIAIILAAPTNLNYGGTNFSYSEGGTITTLTPTVTGTVTNCISAPTLTAGLSLNTTTCAISGAPTTHHTSTAFTITASNAGGNTSVTINITVNENLNKRFFVTLAGYIVNSAFNSASGADSICNSDAGKPVGGVYKAIIVDGTRTASVSSNAGDGQVNWVLKPNTTYYKADGVTAVGTTNANGIFIANLTTPIFTNSKYWTGLNPDWTTGANCNNWTDILGNSNVGNASSITMTGILNGWGTGACNFSGSGYQLLCVEQ